MPVPYTLHRRRALAALLASAAASAHAADWLQFGFDRSHSGNNAEEKGYATPTGNVTVFHTAIPLPIKAPDNNAVDTIDSSPIYASGIVTSSGTKNVIFAMSKFGMLVALDASNASVLWSKSQTGFPLNHTKITNGSPVVDANKQYVYAYMLDGYVHKYAVADGTEITGNGWPELSSSKPDVEKGAASLSIAIAQTGTAYLYSVTDGYIGDRGDYQGHVTAIDLSTGSQKVFNTSCSDLTIHMVENGITTGPGRNDCKSVQGGIWGRPGAVYDPGTNRLFITTGNGSYDPANEGHFGMDWGDSVLALNPDGSGSGNGLPVDNYTPTTFGSSNAGDGLQGNDADLGAVSVALLPTPPGASSTYQHIGLQAGKDGCVRLINLANMNGHNGPATASGPSFAGGEIDLIDLPGGSNCASGGDGPEIQPQPAVWTSPADASTWAYVASYFHGAAAYKIVADGSGKPSLSLQWTGANCTTPVYANGIVYCLSGSKVIALDATSGASIWSSTALNAIHWQSLIVVDEHVYAINGGSQLWSFLLDGVFRGRFE